jgi:hypothetical protein
MFLGGIKRVPYVDMSNSYLCHSWLKLIPRQCYAVVNQLRQRQERSGLCKRLHLLFAQNCMARGRRCSYFRYF